MGGREGEGTFTLGQVVALLLLVSVVSVLSVFSAIMLLVPSQPPACAHFPAADSPLSIPPATPLPPPGAGPSTTTMGTAELVEMVAMVRSIRADTQASKSQLTAIESAVHELQAAADTAATAAASTAATAADTAASTAANTAACTDPEHGATAAGSTPASAAEAVGGAAAAAAVAGKTEGARAGTTDASGEAGHPTTRTINFVYGLWDDVPMRAEFAANLRAWRTLNPAWSTKVWSAREVKKLWKDNYPEYIDLWRLSRPIQRADIARLMIVIKLGGLYADLDTAPTKPIDDVLQVGGYRFSQHSTVLCVEDVKTEEEMAASARWAIRKGEPEYKTRIANYVFFGQPGSAVLTRALALVATRIRETPVTAYHVPGRPDLKNPYAIIYTSGPDSLTDATFVRRPGGGREMPSNDVLILAEDKCHMNNMATGTWIGDSSPATTLG